jgi:hypothetical protein
MAGFNRTRGRDQPSGGCRFLKKPHRCATAKGKVLYLLTFMAQAGCAHFAISLGKTLPFPRHTFA